MPVFAKLSKAVYDKLGEEVVNELVDWLNAVDARFREDYYDRLRLYNSWTHLEARQRLLFPYAWRTATHVVALGQLYALLDAHARLFRIGSALITPSNFERDPYDRAQLDLCVLAARDGKPAREWTGPEPPLLAVEIVSSTAPAGPEQAAISPASWRGGVLDSRPRCQGHRALAPLVRAPRTAG